MRSLDTCVQQGMVGLHLRLVPLRHKLQSKTATASRTPATDELHPRTVQVLVSQHVCQEVDIGNWSSRQESSVQQGKERHADVTV